MKRNRIAVPLTLLTLAFACFLLMLPHAFAEEITVTNVDELIAAVAPGNVIRLTEGDFELSAAETYGQRSGNPYVSWEEIWQGYQLTIHDVDDLTIIGSGREKTQLLAECPSACVLSLEYCTNITLEGFTGGHRTQAMACEGGVVQINRSENITLRDMGLFGCGSFGVNAMNSRQILAVDCEIYDCSSAGFYLTGCDDVQIQSSTVRGIGKLLDGIYPRGYTVFSINHCTGVTASGCTVCGCSVNTFLSAYEIGDISFRNNSVRDNSFTMAVFELFDKDIVVETSNVFENNTFGRWYAGDTGMGKFSARDENGMAMFTEDPAPLSTAVSEATAVPVIAAEQRQVEAATVDEFLAAIDSDTRIILTGDLYDLSTAKGYGKTNGKNYRWEEVYDGFQLVISDVSNLSVVTMDSSRENTVISATPRYANVLTFDFCSNVELSGFTAGHTKEPGACVGGVLGFRYCENVLVENCGLFGCGILGVSGTGVIGMQVINSEIYECSEGGIAFYGSSGITVDGCTFRDLAGAIFRFYGCTDVTVCGKELGGDYCGD